ncbi:hypothetical protein NC653_003816 [Populus alba x Populus x berolinensis]|uniref:Uncharacterized protein n=1 Tax=Populus alba x Populus x berolinensis TaxID=444605 RepID=A0AAD6WIM1_9ROSI|nr:hypothetical protein NC653_003816 [Populus alba x Populus x berolinensis]
MDLEIVMHLEEETKDGSWPTRRSVVWPAITDLTYFIHQQLANLVRVIDSHQKYLKIIERLRSHQIQTHALFLDAGVRLSWLNRILPDLHLHEHTHFNENHCDDRRQFKNQITHTCRRLQSADLEALSWALDWVSS